MALSSPGDSILRISIRCSGAHVHVTAMAWPRCAAMLRPALLHVQRRHLGHDSGALLTSKGLQEWLWTSEWCHQTAKVRPITIGQHLG
jgi:hypothetical protein